MCVLVTRLPLIDTVVVLVGDIKVSGGVRREAVGVFDLAFTGAR
jgi:hypothetical protein